MLTNSTELTSPLSRDRNIKCESDSGTNLGGEIFDPAFGIRISNPKIGTDTLYAFCSGMQKIRLGHLNEGRLKAQQQNGEEWMTMGVLVEKSECKKSTNGNEFMIWRISDLKDLNAVTVKVLLFGDCVKQYWKLQPGNTILLNNPQLAEPSPNSGNNSKNEITLKLFKAGQIIEIGFCPDFGRCQGRKAADGEQCTHFVNVSRSLYCPFHLQQRARHVAANRGTLNQSANVPPKNWRRFRETTRHSGGADEQPPPGLKTLSRKSTAEHGKIYTLPKAVQRSLPTTKMSMETTNTLELEKKSQQIEHLMADNPFNVGTKNLRIMRSRRESADPKHQAEIPISSSSTQKSMHSMREFIQTHTFKQTAKNEENTSKVSNVTAAKRMRSEDDDESMKIKRAAQILKECGNKTKRPKTDCEQKIPTANRSLLLGSSISKEQIHALLAKKSTHEEEAMQEELDRQNSYFQQRELEEQIEANATSLMEIKNCKVVTCKECDYTSAHQSVYCRTQGHQVRRYEADKRFFKCMDCQRRTTSYERLPTKPCLGCKSKRFLRVAMRDERKIFLEEEKLKIKETEGNFSTAAID